MAQVEVPQADANVDGAERKAAVSFMRVLAGGCESGEGTAREPA
jgi:hypothetical protein